MTLMSVLLPLPFSPARQCTSPRPTENDTSSSARTPPKRTDTCSKRIASEAGAEGFGDGVVMEVNAVSGEGLGATARQRDMNRAFGAAPHPALRATPGSGPRAGSSPAHGRRD